jgi:HEAT repeat protein
VYSYSLRGLAASEPVSAAIQCLGYLGDRRAVDVLITCLSSDSSSIRSASAEALGHIGDTRATSRLLTAVTNRKYDIMGEAIAALGQIGDPAAVVAVMARIQDSEYFVRERAAKALGALGDASAIPALETVEISDPTAGVREACGRSLYRLRSINRSDGKPLNGDVPSDKLQTTVQGRVVTANDVTRLLRSLPIQRHTSVASRLDYDHDLYVKAHPTRAAAAMAASDSQLDVPFMGQPVLPDRRRVRGTTQTRATRHRAAS